jgi:carbon-monoxide dehydrogenase small subunit
MITVNINGTMRTLAGPPGGRLLDALRLELGLTGTKEGCGEGECGSCTVLLDGAPVNACLLATGQVAGRRLMTVEGLSQETHLSALGRCFVEHGGAQCGICTPGMLVAAHALLERNPSPTEAEVREAIAGNLCRCTGYQRIVNSILEAATLLQAQPGGPR